MHKQQRGNQHTQKNSKRLLIRQDENALCKSAEYQRNFYSQTKIDIQQINELKQKAHKSFLQVIQMEHLHQEEIDLLRQQYEQQERFSKQKEQQLQKKIANLETEIKLLNKYKMDISNSSFTLDNIDMICLRDLNEQLRADESTLTILQIKELIQSKQLSKDQKLKNLRKQIFKELDGFELNPQEKRKIDQVFDKMYNAMKQIQQDNFQFSYKLQDLQKKYQSLETQYKSLRIQYQSSQKQARFLTDHIKRLSSQKFHLDKNLVQVSKHNKVLEQTVKYLKQVLSQKGKLKGTQLPLLIEDNKSCANINMDMSAFSNSQSHDWMLEDLNASKQSAKTLKTSLFLRHGQNSKLNKQQQRQHRHSQLNSIKSFRKKPIQQI